MRKGTCLLAAMAAMAIALPAGAQTSGGSIGVGNQQASQAQVPQPADGNVNWKGVGIGAGTVAGNVLYVPAKLVFGILGGITGGASYLLTGGNTQTANTIWRSSLGGDYVLTPDMVAGQKPIHFSGPTTSSSPPAPSATSFAQPAASSSTNTATNSTMQPMPSGNVSASAANVGGVNSAPVGTGSTFSSTMNSTGSTAAQPADRGAGPVSSGRSVSGVAAPPLPGTSIE